MSLQLRLTLAEGTMLPAGREPVSIETFVDDTYQNLIGTGNEAYVGGNGQSTVSEDGRELIFSVATGRSPAAEATRVFVRGSVPVRFQPGPSSVASSKLALAVGEQTMVGPFHTVIRSISAPGADTRVDLSIAVDGDASRIQKVRVLDSRPRENAVASMPPRRAPFNPNAASGNDNTKPSPASMDSATVDLFSITVAKPAPSEVEGVEWKHAPSPAFYASGL